MFSLFLMFSMHLSVCYTPYIMRGTRDSITSKEAPILKELMYGRGMCQHHVL